jgi:hypothetical protein
VLSAASKRLSRPRVGVIFFGLLTRTLFLLALSRMRWVAEKSQEVLDTTSQALDCCFHMRKEKKKRARFIAGRRKFLCSCPKGTPLQVRRGENQGKMWQAEADGEGSSK